MISRHLQLISSQFSTVPLYTLVAAIHPPLRFLKPPAPPLPPQFELLLTIMSTFKWFMIVDDS